MRVAIRLNDWVLLSNDYYGKVIGISLEFIELIDTGGGHKTFIVSDFLSLSPLNHSTGFRVIHTLGISYRHQKESTDTILILLEEYIKQQFQNEKYGEHLKTLVVQFSDAGDSSLQLVIIASFDGELASIYFRLRRAIARWSVDACSHYDWEIPFPQLTINHASANIETTQNKGEI